MGDNGFAEMAGYDASESRYAAQRNCTIETTNGWFDANRPTFDYLDIAHALAKKCRFGGHCHQFYSVAEHAVLVSRIMEELGGDPREGYHHDDNEAYGPDFLSPQKQLLPDSQRFMAKLDGQLRRWYGLPPFKTRECTHADNVAVLIEAKAIMRSHGEGPQWAALDPWRADAERLSKRQRFHIHCFDPERARTWYIQRGQELYVV
jgi:hypothetical protein